MNTSYPDTMASGAAGAPWHEYPGRRVIVRALGGSYTNRCAPVVLREAERAAEALEKLLSPSDEQHGAKVVLYLSDPLATAAQDISDADSAAGEASGVLVIQPEAERESTVPMLTRMLLSRWRGPEVAAEPLLREGIAGLVAARIGIGPPVDEAHAQVRADLAAGRTVSIMSRSATEHDAAVYRIWATSFIAFLAETFGLDALSTFLAAYDPDRRDQAAQTAYQRPLGAIEESWLTGLRRPARSESAFRTLFRYLIPLLAPYRLRLVEILIYMLIGLGYSLAVPLASKYLVDTILPNRDVSALLLLLLGLLVFFILNSLLGVRRGYLNSWINQRILIDLRERMFAHLQRLPHNFYATAKVGDIMARLTSDLQQFQQAMSKVAGVGIFLALRALTAAVTLLILSPLLGLLVLITVPIFAASYFLLEARFERAAYEQQRLMGETIAMTQENLLAHAVIKALGLEEQAIAAYHSRLGAAFSAYLRLIVVALIYETSTTLAVTVGQLVVLGVGGYLVISGNITIGTLLAFLGVLPSLFDPISALSDVGQTVQSASGAMSRVNELLEEPVVIADRPGASASPTLAREIRFDHVTFGYDAERQILQDLSLTIQAGKNVAIVGPSGSGKSTIVNLLMRFWDPDDGQILLDGRDLRDITLASLRSQIGIVFQDTFVFDTTLRENIRIGRGGATDAEIVAAAQAARLDSYIAMLPNGYDTVLGERGVRMSGGQRQRLAIARALLRDPRILVLDEATSALDAQTEKEILDTLAVAARGRTTISITHRLALAAAADEIIVLDQGRLVEQGPHAELLQTGGLYRRLYDEQMSYITGGGPQRADVEVARLRAIPLFAGMGSEALTPLAARLELERHAAGEDIVRQDDLGERLYLIERGQVEVLVANDHGERRINLLSEGDYFGEMALLSDQSRSATVRTTMPTQLYSLSRADFTELLEQEPGIREAVSAVVAARRSAFAATGATKAA